MKIMKDSNASLEEIQVLENEKKNLQLTSVKLLHKYKHVSLQRVKM